MEITDFFNQNDKKPIQLFVTANIVLHDFKNDTFSVFYGQDYTNDHFKYALYGPVTLKNLHDLRLLPDLDTEEEVSSVFERYHYEKSGLSVFKVINSVWVIRIFD